jgi:hypothetical protein
VPFYVDRVHKARTPERSHTHIACVHTVGSDRRWTPAQVAASILSGEEWLTRGTDGSSARIRPLAKCPFPGCSFGPDITTYPDHTRANNLDNLPPC